MVKPIPENITTLLSELSTTQQVAIRGYIASLRTEIKDLEAELLAKSDPDPHAHFHGEEKCTIDHGHKDHDHKGHDRKEHDHKEHDHKGRDHKEHDHKEHKHEHQAHDHHDHAHEKPCTADHDHQAHEHKHDHGDGKPCTINHDHQGSHKHDNQHRNEGGDHKKGHEHNHKENEHKHEHTPHETDAMPAWKKKALESGDNDTSVAPFGGDWNSETIRNLNEDKMEE